MTETVDPPTWRVVVEFTGVDLDDDDVVDALVAGPVSPVGLASSEFVTTVTANVAAPTYDRAVTQLCEAVDSAAPRSVLHRFVDPLITIADIADDAGVTREAVRNWATGLRQSGFPSPLALVGDGVRIWRQADVDHWLHHSLNLGSGLRYGSAANIAFQNEKLAPGENVVAFEGDGWTECSDITEVQDEQVERLAPSRARAGATTEHWPTWSSS